MKINLDLPGELLTKVDSLAKQQIMSRAELLRQAIREKVFPQMTVYPTRGSVSPVEVMKATPVAPAGQATFKTTCQVCKTLTACTYFKTEDENGYEAKGWLCAQCKQNQLQKKEKPLTNTQVLNTLRQTTSTDFSGSFWKLKKKHEAS